MVQKTDKAQNLANIKKLWLPKDHYYAAQISSSLKTKKVLSWKIETKHLEYKLTYLLDTVIITKYKQT